MQTFDSCRSDNKVIPEIASVLNAAAGYLQREVGRRIRMKFTPRFRFHVDTQGKRPSTCSLLSDIRSQLDEE